MATGWDKNETTTYNNKIQNRPKQAKTIQNPDESCWFSTFPVSDVSEIDNWSSSCLTKARRSGIWGSNFSPSPMRILTWTNFSWIGCCQYCPTIPTELSHPVEDSQLKYQKIMTQQICYPKFWKGGSTWKVLAIPNLQGLTILRGAREQIPTLW